jgi:hypothetical protein
MIDSAPAERAFDPRDTAARTSFLSSHRAQAVCTREFARLSEGLVAATKILAVQTSIEPPTVRLSPDRCIVQLGPVALTVAWLRNGTDVPAAGQLLCIVWRGVIAPRGEHAPERRGWRQVPATPQAVWEETCLPSATSEATWHWHPESLEREGYASLELASRCIDQLRTALEALLQDAPIDSGSTT